MNSYNGAIFRIRINTLTREAHIIILFSQLFRIPTGVLGSMFGILPIGNTGGSNVPPFKKMEVRDDLQKMLQ